MVNKKKKILEIGQEVFLINSNLEIVAKKIVAIVKEEIEIKYQLDVEYCKGLTEQDFFLIEDKAERAKQDFLDKLKFKVGDLVIFRRKDWGNWITRIGRIDNIHYTKEPYSIRTDREHFYSFTHRPKDKEMVLKINNSYLENFGRIKELNKKFKESIAITSAIQSLMHKEHDLLEAELHRSFKKQFAWHTPANKPLFKDRFNYKRDYDFD